MPEPEIFSGQRFTSAVADQIVEQLDSKSAIDGVGTRPLVSSSATWAVIQSKTYDFLNGYAYKIQWQARVQLNSASATTMYAAEIGILRSNASGTSICSPGYTTVLGNANWANIGGFVIVKVTGGDTTQTIAMCGRYAGTNAPTSMDVEAQPASPSLLDITIHGLAADHSGALELPTS